jgi:hypothetical protein
MVAPYPAGKRRTHQEEHPMPETIPCPDPACPAPAQILDRWSWESTDGPVEHVKTRCPHGHGFTPTVDSLVAQPTGPPQPAMAAFP